MEFSDNTMTIFKNFADINQNILVKEGTKLKTISEARNVLSIAELDDTFPKCFGIYDLSEFIGVTNLVDKPNLSFEDEYLTISDSTGRSKIKYFYSAIDTLTTPSKDIVMPEGEVKFKLESAVLDKIKRAASTLGHTEVSIANSDGAIKISVIDSQNTTSNTFSIDIPGEYQEGTVFNYILNISNLKIIPDDYEVKMSSKLITQFFNPRMKVSYWIALEKSSTFGV